MNKTFSIGEFGGLVTAAPLGAVPMRWQRAEGFAFRPEIGGLTTVAALQQLGAATVNAINSVYNPINQALYVVDSASKTLFRTNDAAGWTDLGSNYSTPLAIDSGMGVQYTGNPVDAAFSAKFLGETGQTDTKYTPAAPVVSWAAVADANSALLAGNYRVEMVWMRKIVYGTKSFYVRADSVTGKAQVTATASIAVVAGQSLQISITSVPSDMSYGIFLFYSASGTLRGPYFYGIVDAGALTGAKLRALPVEITSALNDSLYSQFSSRVKGSAVLFRSNRVWVAGNASRDYSDDNTISGINSSPPAPNKTLFYSNINQTYFFNPENYIELSIDGDITALAPLGDALAVFSATEIWAITGNSIADFNPVKLESIQKGAVSGETISYRGAVYYLGNDGLYRLDSSGATTRLSDPIYDVFANGIPSIVSMSLDRTNNLLNLSLNSTMYVLDLENNEWLKAQEAVRAVENNLLAVNNTVTTRSNTSALATRFLQTQHLDLGMPQLDKQLRRLSLAFENNGPAATLTIKMIAGDGTTTWTSSPQNVPATSRSRLTFPLAGNISVNRGAALLLELNAAAGVTLVAPMDIDYIPRGERNR